MTRLPALLLAALTALLSGAHAVPISNTATLVARGLRVNSNTVDVVRAAACDPQVTPDGPATAPGRTVTLQTPGSVTVPYTVTHVGTAAGPVEVSAALLTPVPGVQVRLQEPAQVLMQPGERRTVNVIVLATDAAQGRVDVNLSARCGPAADVMNVTRVELRPELQLLLRHTVTPGVGEIGQLVTFTVGLPNPARQDIVSSVTVTLPTGLEYRSGTARSGVLGVPATVSADGRRVTFSPPTVAAGDTLTLTYDAQVGPQVALDARGRGALEVPAVATARVDGRELVSAAAAAHLIVTPGVFDRRATVIGEVFLDVDADGRRDPQDTPLVGARVLLPNGLQTVTDAQGRYAIRDLQPGPWLLRLDPATAPFQAVPGHGDRLVDVFALTRVDFALRVPSAPQPTPGTLAALTHDTMVRAGPLVVTRHVAPQPGGASVVTLTLSTARPVQDVVIIDRSGPDGAPREFRVATLGAPVTFTYVTLTPAGPNDPDVLWREP